MVHDALWESIVKTANTHRSPGAGLQRSGALASAE